jgi:bacterioferritin-associated ferredoxin
LAARAAIAALRGGMGEGRRPRASLRAPAGHARGRTFLDVLYRPARAFRVPEDATLVCRCEEVTAGEIRDCLRQGCAGPNQLKAFLRCGMGSCQGRLCGLTVTELIADCTGARPQDVGYLRLRPPVKPIALGELAALPTADAATSRRS